MEKNSNTLHYRHCILHLFHCGVSASKAYKTIRETYGSDSVNHNTCRRWYRKFQVGNFELKDEKRCGRPHEILDYDLEELVEQNPNMSMQELGRMLGVNRSTISRRLAALGFKPKPKKRRKLQEEEEEEAEESQ
ncbi:histone-lysine N-methyltransferase SETMAR-like [Phlebotomus argentipes]|uniref:histone-lysine N-methyltransferase SETMAR-like n=1 Tax=Phlebotomus argentipes TaxID=94469 RepID=UPI0028933E7A|nr:histone-lysine N-methyltransferase SETMAR-like [Phlebotomus argentipes]